MNFRTIDAHTGGEPLRLILDGWPEPEGSTILEKRAFARAKQDHLRRVLMFEPRGHADMYGALLTKPERPDSDTGVLFMHNEGYSLMCGHGIIAVTRLIVERNLVSLRSEGRVVFDAPAGQITATYTKGRVSFVNVPSFVLAAGVPVITTPISGIPEVVDEAVGWLVPPDDVQALRAAITQALSDPAEACRRGEAGRARPRTPAAG